MSEDISTSLDIDEIASHALDRILALFSRDSVTAELAEHLKHQARLAATRARYVMCVGMSKPIPINNIFQPRRLVAPGGKLIAADSLLESDKSAIIYAGAGQGKTTFLHWFYMQLLDSDYWTPLLVTLRNSDAVRDLDSLIQGFENTSRPPSPKVNSLRITGHRLVLLVDGYDEIDKLERRKVSESLERFESLDIGVYILTCRQYYDVIDLKSVVYDVAAFTRRDALSYMEAFSRAYEVHFDAEALLAELEERGFRDFASSPLMLALVCILKTGPMKSLPRNTIGLIRRAIDTLTFRWDEAKGISRDTRLSFDGEERVRCLMRIAYYAETVPIPESLVHQIVQGHLKLLQRHVGEAGQLLREMAQWYSLFVPVSDAAWSFVHRTIHDFLAARFWVEGGMFYAPNIRTWNARAAYAICLQADATKSIVHALRSYADFGVLAECFYNNPPFDVTPVAEALLDYFKADEKISISRTPSGLILKGGSEKIFGIMTLELLERLLTHALREPSEKHSLFVLGVVLSEWLVRGERLDKYVFESAVAFYGTTDFKFSVERRGEFMNFALMDLAPNKASDSD